MRVLAELPDTGRGLLDLGSEVEPQSIETRLKVLATPEPAPSVRPREPWWTVIGDLRERGLCAGFPALGVLKGAARLPAACAPLSYRRSGSSGLQVCASAGDLSSSELRSSVRASGRLLSQRCGTSARP